MHNEPLLTTSQDVSRQLYFLRKQRVILDSDLARLYGVTTKRLNEQYRRNLNRFPEDFAFQLTDSEWAALRSQIVILNTGVNPSPMVADSPDLHLKSQIATSSFAHGGRRKLPIAYTEHGALMAANVLNSPQAVTMSIYVIRAFVQMREEQATNAAILKRLAEIDKSLLLHDTALRDIYQKLRPLLEPPPLPPKPEIGFHVKEVPNPDRVKRKSRSS